MRFGVCAMCTVQYLKNARRFLHKLEYTRNTLDELYNIKKSGWLKSRARCTRCQPRRGVFVRPTPVADAGSRRTRAPRTPGNPRKRNPRQPALPASPRPLVSLIRPPDIAPAAPSRSRPHDVHAIVGPGVLRSSLYLQSSRRGCSTRIVLSDVVPGVYAPSRLRAGRASSPSLALFCRAMCDILGLVTPHLHHNVDDLTFLHL